VTPGFTGGRLDRADRLRHDADALAEATNWRARLLVLGPGYEPEVGQDGRLGWTSLAQAPEDADLVLLGLDEGRAHFAAITNEAGGAPFRSPRLLAALALMEAGEAATYAAARSVLDWHARHRFCANCGVSTAPFPRGVGAQVRELRHRAFPARRPGRHHAGRT
jgi:NAD+ diphosphatase